MSTCSAVTNGVNFGDLASMVTSLMCVAMMSLCSGDIIHLCSGEVSKLW